MIDRPAVAVAVAVALVVGGGSPASADRSPATPETATPQTAAAARAEASRVALQVDELTTEYRRRLAETERSAAELAAALSAANRADVAARTAEQVARQARTRQAVSVRALYVEGGVGTGLTFLTAPTGADALWRASTGRRIARTVLHVAEADTDRTDLAVHRARTASARSEASSRAVAEARRTLDENAEATQLVLEAARLRLDRMSARAKELTVAEEAAARLAAARAAAAAATTELGPVTATEVPAGYALLYRSAAGRCPGLRWSLLAAVGQVESGHGRNNGPSWAGAIGPMQFMPATFDAHGVDGDGDGVRDPWNPADAIPSAAAYLCASGLDPTPQGVRDALFAYNRSQAYVDLVLATEQAILGSATAPAGP